MSIVLTEQLSLLATAPDGIQKLRCLILELAMRGKLVPQDPSDEPASELLERVAKERARLEAAGISKKQKPLPLLNDDEKPYVLPSLWTWTRLGEITNFGQADKNGEITEHTWVLDLEDIQKDNSVLLHKVRFATRQAKSDKNRFRAGDVLYGKLRPYLNKVIVADEEGVCTTEILPVRGFCGLAPRFLMHALKRPDFLSYVNAKSYGMKMPRLGTDDGRLAVFPLPPEAEQHRIAARIDELMALCDRLETEQSEAESAHAKLVDILLGTLTQNTDAADFATNWQRIVEHFDTLFKTESSLDALKQTILQLAVMGKLVPQDPNEGVASQLLNQIAQERAHLIIEGKIKKSKVVSTIEGKEQPFPIPSSWEWVRLEAISQIVTDGEHATPTRTTDHSAVPLVTAKNVRDGYLDYTRTDFVPQDVAEKCWKRCKPMLGDILLVSVGATLGRLSILDHDKDMVIVRSVTLIRPCIVDRNYFATALRSPIIQQLIWSGVKQSAQPGLYLAQSSSLPIPLPPLSEQHRIVLKLNKLMAFCDRLKDDLSESRRRQEQLASALIESTLKAA